MRNFAARWAPTAIVLLSLSACVSTPAPRSVINSAEQQKITEFRRASLQPITQWNIQGRIAIDYRGEGFSAGLKWQQRDENFDISLTDPLGRTAARLDGSAEGVVLYADGETYEAESPETLMVQNLGWSLPLDSLIHWSKGIPDPDHPLTAVGYDVVGRPITLIQDGWQVNFERYPDAEVLAQPQRITLLRPEFKAKLLIKERDLTKS